MGVEETEGIAGITTPSTLTFNASSTTASVTLDLAGSSNTGTYAASSNNEKASFTIATNNATGYTVKVKSTTNTPVLTNGSNNVSIISNNGITIDSSSFDVNSWGILPNYYNCTTSNCTENTTNYYKVDTNGFTIKATGSANSNNGIDNPDSYTLGLGLKANYNTPAGTYTNTTLVIEYTANPIAYTINYNKGRATGDITVPATQSSSTTETNVTLSNAVPAWTGYDFKGWCLGTITTTNNVDSCSGTIYNPNGAGTNLTFGIDQTLANNTATLTAMWNIKTFTITKQYKLQGTDGSYPSSYTSGGTETVNYGGSYTYSIAATTTHQAASQTISNVTSAQTISLDVLRNTRTVSLTKGTGISAVAVTGTGVKPGSGTASATVYYGGAVTIAATLTSGYDWVNWTGSSTYTNQSQSINSVTSNLSFTANGEKSDPCKGHGSELYCKVAAMSKGTQTLANLRAAITTANSGVYEYNTSVFGAAKDAASTHTIYYYRGILDQTAGSYGSNGDGKAWPNYVILDANGTKDTSDTCWRIVRTTGSGGVKMIYNGKWTGSTCANATTAAQVTTKVFGSTAEATSRSIVGVGYTRNANYASTSATTATAYSTLFGSNSSYSGNSTASDMKKYLEGTWFTNISSYESKLEKSAGWCNDRSIRSSSSSTSVISDSTTIVPYGTSGMTQYYFGSYVRTETTSDKPTLGCPRSNADLYTTSSASNGNKQLGKPVALLTADEAAFAGSGRSSSATPYHANSYLRSGSEFWLLSPRYRYSGGSALGFVLSSSGALSNYNVGYADGVRPAISLVSGTTISSGSGIATDPWVVQP